MPTLDILGVPHAYELTPISPKASTSVLIFIHGWLLSRNYWHPLIQQLAPDYQCLIYDLRGFGSSQPLPTDESQASRAMLNVKRSDAAQPLASYSSYTLAAYARDLSILLQKLEIERAWLIGHSLGGSIALWTAQCCADKVKGVICLNSGGGIYLKEEFERFRSAGQQLLKRRPRWLSLVPLIDLLFTRMMVKRPLALHWGHQRVVDFVNANGEAALGALLDSTTEAEVHLLPQVVSRLQQPVYFLAGAQDRVMELKYVHHLASFHKLFTPQGNNVIEIPDCGHFAMLEQPEIVTAQIVNILMKHCSE
jgi:2-succinyl-6-hydroxy-2,4-cyclohexadiene-1-carboxylate synthase